MKITCNKIDHSIFVLRWFAQMKAKEKRKDSDAKSRGSARFPILVLLGLLLWSPLAQAALFTWTGAVSTDWSIPQNWTSAGGGIPGALDDVTIPPNVSVAMLTTASFAKTVTIQDGGSLNLNGQSLTVNGNLSVTANNTAGLLMNNPADVLTVNGDASFFSPNNVQNPANMTAGVIHLRGNLTTQAGVGRFISAGTHKVVFDGTAMQTVTFNGGSSSTSTRFNDVEISNPSGVSFAGTVFVAGNFTQTAAAKLDIQIASGTSHGLLNVAGNSTLNGALSATLTGGFVPALNQKFTVIQTTGSTRGTFTSVVPTGFTLFQTAPSVILKFGPNLLPTIGLTMDSYAFNATTNKTMTLTATTMASSPPTNADVYLAVQLPDGTLLVMQPGGGFGTALTPLLSNISIPNFSGPVFTFTFTGTEPVGNYTWFAALTTPGSLNVIGTLASAPFSFTP